MTHTAVVEHPTGAVYLTMRPHYVAATDRNPCAAGLLAVIEMWTNIRLRDGKDEWVYRTQTQLSYDLAGAWKEDAIKKATDLLIAKGLIEKRRNPRLGFDKTWQYRLVVENVQRLADEWPHRITKPADLDNREQRASKAEPPGTGDGSLHASEPSTPGSAPGSSRTSRLEHQGSNTDNPENTHIRTSKTTSATTEPSTSHTTSSTTPREAVDPSAASSTSIPLNRRGSGVRRSSQPRRRVEMGPESRDDKYKRLRAELEGR